MRVHLVSFIGPQPSSKAFANDALLQRRQEALHQSALAYGDVHQCHGWSFEQLRLTQYYRDNQALLDRPRGCGYWAWKPYIILNTLEHSDDGDVVIYCDVGKPLPNASEDHGNLIERSLLPLVDWAKQHNGMLPGVYLPHHGPAGHWIKRDCFKIMGCDTPEYHQHPTIQAGYTVWQKTASAVNFLKQWMQLNLDPCLITDDENQMGAENLPGFQRHCHDQATLTLLCQQQGVSVFGDPQRQFWGFRNINYIAREAALQLRQAQGDSAVAQWAQETPSFPRCLRRWLDLLFGEDLHRSAHITATDPQLSMRLSVLFPQATVQNASATDTTSIPKSDLLVVTELPEDEATAALLQKLYLALNDNGVLMVGPLPDASEFEHCARFVSSHGAFPAQPQFDRIDAVLDCPKIPNSRNPVFIRAQQGLFCVMIKPKSVPRLHQALSSMKMSMHQPNHQKQTP